MMTTKKITLGEYIVYGSILTYLYLLSTHAIWYFDLIFHDSEYIELVVIVIIDTILFLLILKLPYPLVLFGFNLHRWKRYVLETIIYSILFCVLVTGIKWLLIQTVPSLHHLPLIELAVVYFTGGMSTNYAQIALDMAIYVIILIPLQVFVVHGAVQSLILHFLEVKYRGFLSIIVGTLWFSVMHLSLPYGFAVSMLLPGLFVSTLYSRQKSLLGMWIAHTMIGVWGLYFLDISSFLSHLTH